MRIVIISYCSTVDRHIIGRVRSRWPDAIVVRPTWPSNESDIRKIARSVRSPVRSLRRQYHRVREEHRFRALGPVLTAVVPKSVIAPVTVPVADLNRPPGIRRIAALRPDLLLLCGAPILRDGLLAVPSMGTINVHFGIAPQYCGEHTLFHALRKRDYDRVGLTIHGVDSGIDTGPVIIQANPPLEPTDDETSVLGKCTTLAADLLVEYLEVLEQSGKIVGRAQRGTGVLYRRDDRRVFRHDLVAMVSRRVLRRRPPRRPERITRYYEPIGDRAGR